MTKELASKASAGRKEIYIPIVFKKEDPLVLSKRLNTEFIAQLNVCRETIPANRRNSEDELNRAFYAQAERVQRLLIKKLNSTDPLEQDYVHQALTRLTTALKNPKDAMNMKQLALLAQEVPYASSAYWQDVASSVLLISALVTFVAFYATLLATGDPAALLILIPAVGMGMAGAILDDGAPQKIAATKAAITKVATFFPPKPSVESSRPRGDDTLTRGIGDPDL